MKHLKKIFLIHFIFFVILSCKEEKEKATDWDALLPGNYVGDIHIKSIINSAGEWTWYGKQSTLYSWHNDTTISTNAQVRSTKDGFDVDFEENGIMELETISFFVLDYRNFVNNGSDYTPIKPIQNIVFSNFRGSISTKNAHDDNTYLRIFYDILTPFDSALWVDFTGIKSYP